MAKHNWLSAIPQPQELVTVPGGSFVMGTDAREVRQLLYSGSSNRNEWYNYEQPSHILNLGSYQIGRYPVTVGQFAVFIQAGGYQNPAHWSPDGWRWRASHGILTPEYWAEQSHRSDYPVVGVSLYEVLAYTGWLQAETGHAFRLPTEAEWEKAARGPDGRRYPWGNHWEARNCNVAQEFTDSWDEPVDSLANPRLVAVGANSPRGDSPYGCADMAGNIWEWCMSRLRRYPLRSPGPARLQNQHEPYVVRGGSWYHGPEDARCAARYSYYPHGRDNVVGFRLAL